MLGTSKEKRDDASGVVETESGEYKEEDESDLIPSNDENPALDAPSDATGNENGAVLARPLPSNSPHQVKSKGDHFSTAALSEIENHGNAGTAKQLRSPRLSFDNTERLALDKEWEKGRHILQGDDLVVSTIDKIVEEGPRTQESGQPKSSQESEADDTNLQGPECLFPDTHQLETPEATMGQDVIMSDSEISGMIVTVKSVFMEHTEDYGIPQLERLYTRVIKDVFEAKASEPGDDDLRPSILSYFLKFGENTTNF
ncbi:hypothetical protein U1Q18_032492 [Sarracenia purpurea var. burkii]